MTTLSKCQLELSSKSITHSGKLGEVSEKCIIEFLKKHMPQRYAVDSGIIIDSTGKTSDQIDIVIFDNQYTPTLLDQQDHRYIPAEAVYSVIEVKQEINKANIEYAGQKAASVRELTRTSISITHAGGTFPPKPLHGIISGLIGLRCGWVDGLNATAFKDCVCSLNAHNTLDFGLALTDCAFDFFDNSTLSVCSTSCSLAFFLFRLLGKLQTLGTVPAVDWGKYAEALSN